MRTSTWPKPPTRMPSSSADERTADADRWHARAQAIRDTVTTKAAKARADQVRKDFQGFK